MRTPAHRVLAALAFALPLVAQETRGVEAKPAVETQKLWKIECSGIGG
ncbi:MAG: hypothetical protein U1E73_09230 [Planctomycetota bacterium]